MNWDSCVQTTHQLDHFSLLYGGHAAADDRLAAGAQVDERLPQLLGQREVKTLPVNHECHLVRQTHQVVVAEENDNQRQTVF